MSQASQPTTRTVDTYDEAIEYLFTHTDYERMARVRHHADSYDLDRMIDLCRRTGQPQQSFPSVHVAGTKGKGSVTAMTAYLLAGGGLPTGLYTSPHLIDLRERVAIVQRGESSGEARIDSRVISEEQFTAALNSVRRRLDEGASPSDGPTFFELMTAMAFVHFAGSEVAMAALEVGLGGRLDATNVVVPEACAITPVGMDHTRQLGNTIEQIAAEKAGIIKPQVAVISAPQRPAVERVIRRVAAEREAPVLVVGREIELTRRLVDTGRPGPRRWEVTVRAPGGTYGPVVVPLLGRHQAVNLAVALGLLDRVVQSGRQVDLAGALAGLAQTRWPCRLDVRLGPGRGAAGRPWLVLDGAHTVEAMRAVLATLPETFDYDRLIVVIGTLSDKDVAGLVGQLANGARQVVLTRSDHPHAADPRVLADLLAIRAPLIERHVEPDAAEAVGLALKLAGPNDLVLVTGSIYLVGLVARVAQETGWLEGSGGAFGRS